MKETTTKTLHRRYNFIIHKKYLTSKNLDPNYKKTIIHLDPNVNSQGLNFTLNSQKERKRMKKTSESSYKSQKKNFTKIKLTMKNEKGNRIKEAAKKENKSLNAFILDIVLNYLDEKGL